MFTGWVGWLGKEYRGFASGENKKEKKTIRRRLYQWG
ncbi:hypothetical protein KKC1_28030 [Calderihabitans maritimus]|uniref:Uncharacterized protein n=1 Tax=Calderihabitans maritimus TaxID=1246530 RepID=A0A1Z5HWH6_9FIRM|nr:hypothetical protein KKC1_28030 [Calderihabitans maritimus]